MKDFVAALPWRLAALAALLVLILCWTARIDLWVALERACLAFIVFWLLGAFGRTLYGKAAAVAPNAPQAPSRLPTPPDAGEEGPQKPN